MERVVGANVPVVPTVVEHAITSAGDDNCNGSILFGRRYSIDRHPMFCSTEVNISSFFVVDIIFDASNILHFLPHIILIVSASERSGIVYSIIIIISITNFDITAVVLQITISR